MNEYAPGHPRNELKLKEEALFDKLLLRNISLTFYPSSKNHPYIFLLSAMHERIQKVLLEGVQHLTRFFVVVFFVLFFFLGGGGLVNEGRKDPNTTKSGPSSVRQRNAIEMVFSLLADDGPTLILAW